MINLTIINQNGRLLADSREVAEMTGKEHKNLLRDIKGYVEILLGSNLSSASFFIEHSYQDSTGRTLPCYLLTRKGCDMVANKMTGEKGVLFTAAYVMKFEEMERQIQQTTDSYMISDPIERAKRWIQEQEQKEKLSQQLELQKPKVLFADAVETSKTTILVGELAKILRQNGVEIGEKRLFKWLRENGYLISRNGTDYNMPTQKSLELGLFKIKETTISHSDGHISISKTPKVTGKGQIYFINKLKQECVQNVPA